MEFTKRFRRAPDDPGTAQGGTATSEREPAAAPLQQQPPPPDPNSRVAPAQPAAAPNDQTQQLDQAGDQPHYGGAAARTSDHVHGDHDHDGVRDRDEGARGDAVHVRDADTATHDRGVASRDRDTGAAVRDRDDTVRDRDDDTVRDRDIDRGRDIDRDRRTTPARGTSRTAVRDEFGGFNWGSAFFGWLVAIGLGALLTAAITGAGAAVGLTEAEATSNAETIGLGGGILLLIVAMIAWYCGGYVAGRMSRFDGARQGFGVWVFGLIATVAIAAAGWILGDEYNLLERLDLPRIPIDAGDLTTGGLIALAAILFGTLIAAIAGGKFGQRYHNKIDRQGFGEPLR